MTGTHHKCRQINGGKGSQSLYVGPVEPPKRTGGEGGADGGDEVPEAVVLHGLRGVSDDLWVEESDALGEGAGDCGRGPMCCMGWRGVGMEVQTEPTKPVHCIYTPSTAS